MRNSAGFVGTQTLSMTVCVLGLLELCLVTRTCTGKVWMEIISGEAREFIEPVIRQRDRASSEMWSDGHPTYEWLEDVGFDHKTCIHSNREFSKIDEETGDLISTNGIESLFMQMRRENRMCGLCNIVLGGHDDWLVTVSVKPG